MIGQPFDVEKGAGTFNPHTFLRALGPEPWKVAFVEPSRRPTDGRYGDNPNRLYRHHQYQVIIKPSPADMQGLYLASMRAIGIHPEEHDIRFVEDNWESPTLGAWGLGWEVWVDGMELTQFTYFQQCGGLECRPVAGELTYGLERIAMYLQGIDNIYDVWYAPGIKYREVFHQDEVEYSKFAFELLDKNMYFGIYESCEKEVQRLLDAGVVIPAYDHLLKAAHAFNSLDARGAISVTERQGYILRIRNLAKTCAEAYLALRERLGFPLMQGATKAEAPAVVPAPITVSAPAELFVELGCEELPAGEVMPALEALKQGIVDRLAAARLVHGAVRTWATPRRLVVAIDQVPPQQADRTVEVAGPPVKAAFKDGKPTPAAQGFAKGQGVAVEDLITKSTPKGDYLYALVREVGRPTADLLPAMIAEAIAAIPFKKSMRWGTGEVAFSRPLAWLVALLGDQVLPVSYAGITASNQSRGHRFLAPESFEIRSASEWVAEMEKRHVVADVAERRRLIVAGANAQAASVGGQIQQNEALIDEITQLVEAPFPLITHFDPRFLEIPHDVLTSEMKQHQRYLPVVSADGHLLPYFVVVANTAVEVPEVSLGGYRRVLTARFEDGAFFYREDLKTPLFARAEKLKEVRFHRALGTTWEKVERVARLAFGLAEALRNQIGATDLVVPADPYGLASGASDGSLAWSLARAAYLVKADLTAHMVYEFPELQGVIGAEYALKNGELREVAKAIEEHYLPKGQGTPPEGLLGALLGMADRLDTLAGIFATGKGPTGNADPYGLRRAALGVLAILRHRGWHLSLKEALGQALALIGDKRTRELSEIEAELIEFVRTRAKGVLVGEGIAVDVAEAVLVAGSDDWVDAAHRARALMDLRQKPEFEPVAMSFKRVANILKGQTTEPLSPKQLEHPAEQHLYRESEIVAAKVRAAAALRDFPAAMAGTGELLPAVASFFDAVMVMDEDLAVRGRRLALLAQVQQIFAPLADFTKLS